MEIVLVKFRKRTMRSLVVFDLVGKPYKWEKVGDVLEVSDHETAHKFLSEYKDMLQVYEKKAMGVNFTQTDDVVKSETTETDPVLDKINDVAKELETKEKIKAKK